MPIFDSGNLADLLLQVYLVNHQMNAHWDTEDFVDIEFNKHL